MIKAKDEMLFEAMTYINTQRLHTSNRRRKVFKQKRKHYDPKNELMVGMGIITLSALIIIVSVAMSVINRPQESTRYEDGGDVIGSMDEFTLNGNLYNTFDQMVEPQYISNKITTLNDEEKNLKFEIYEIQDIANICAVAVKLNDEEGYHLYNNTEYAPQTLGQLVEDMNLEENLVFEEVYVREGDKEYVCRDYDKKQLYKCIFEENYDSLLETNGEYIQIMDISSRLKNISNLNFFIRVNYENNLCINLFHEEYIFDINNIKELNEILIIQR